MDGLTLECSTRAEVVGGGLGEVEGARDEKRMNLHLACELNSAGKREGRGRLGEQVGDGGEPFYCGGDFGGSE